MASLTRLKASRAGHKSHATRLKKTITDLLLEVNYDDKAQLITLKGHVANYRNQFAKIQKLDDEILSQIDEEEVEATQLRVFGGVRTVFYDIITIR